MRNRWLCGIYHYVHVGWTVTYHPWHTETSLSVPLAKCQTAYRGELDPRTTVLDIHQCVYFRCYHCRRYCTPYVWYISFNVSGWAVVCIFLHCALYCETLCMYIINKTIIHQNILARYMYILCWTWNVIYSLIPVKTIFVICIIWEEVTNWTGLDKTSFPTKM